MLSTVQGLTAVLGQVFVCRFECGTGLEWRLGRSGFATGVRSMGYINCLPRKSADLRYMVEGCCLEGYELAEAIVCGVGEGFGLVWSVGWTGFSICSYFRHITSFSSQFGSE